MLHKEIIADAYGANPLGANHCFETCDFLNKQGSAESISFFNDLTPKKGHLYFLVVAMTAGENYGCFTADNTFVSAEGEMKDISLVEKDDRVISHDGSVNTVNTGIKKQWTGRFVNISTRCIPDTTTTENHEFRVVRKSQVKCIKDKHKRCTPSTLQNSNICFRGKGCSRDKVEFDPEWVKAKDINEGDFLVVPRKRATKKNNQTYEPIHIDYARLIGYFISEGSYEKNKNGLASARFSFNAEEDEYREEIRGITKRFGLNTHTTKVYDYSSTVIISSKHIANKLYEYCGEHSADMEISPTIFNQRDEFIRAMIGAYIDGDGHSSNINGRTTISSSNKKLLLQLKQLLFRLGVPNSWHWNDNPKQRDGMNVSPYGQISINFFDAKRVFSGYSKKIDELEFSYKAKGDSKNIVLDDYILLPVLDVDISGIETRTVYDANIKNVPSYCVNFVSVHNSNKNGDYFKKEDLKTHYKIFDDAGVFWNHDNQDPTKSIGKVLKSFYSDTMERIELVIEVPVSKGRYLADFIRDKKNISVSMGMTTASEHCSICGHVTKASYANRCSHLKYQMNQVFPDGRKVYAISGAPKRLYDISFVMRPADRVAYTMLTKTASEREIGL